MTRVQRWIIVHGIIVLVIGVMTARFWNAEPPTNIYLDMGFPYPLLASAQNLYDAIATQTRGDTNEPLFLVDPNLTELLPKAINLFINNGFLTIKLLLVFQLYLAALFAYLLAQKHTSNTLAAVTTSVVYCTTPFLIEMLNGANSLTWGYVFLPLALFGIHTALERTKWQYGVLAGAGVALATTLATIQFVFYNGIFIAVYTIATLVIETRRARANTSTEHRERMGTYAKRTILTILLILGTAFALSSFYLVPTFMEQGPYARYEGEVEYRKNPYATNFYAPASTEIMRLQNMEWLRSEEIGGALAKLPWNMRAYPLIILIAAIFGVATSSKLRRFSIPLICAVIIPTYFALPYYAGEFHVWLKEVVLGFYTVRTPGRFMIPFLIAVALCAGYGVTTLQRLATERYRYALFMGALLLMVVCVVQGYQYGQHFRTFTTTNIEERYPEGKRIVDQLDYFNPKRAYRILDYTLSAEEGSPHHLKYYTAGHPTLHNAYELYWRYAGTPEFATILRNLNVRYLVTNPDPDLQAIANRHGTEESPTLVLEDRLGKLKSSQGINELYTTPGGITIWEVVAGREKTFTADVVDFKGTLEGYAGFQTLFADREPPLAISGKEKITPYDITIIDSDNVITDEIIERESVPLTPVSALVDRSHTTTDWREHTNEDLFHTAQIGTIFNHPLTKNTVEGRRLYATTVLTTETSSALDISMENVISAESNTDKPKDDRETDNNDGEEMIVGIHTYYQGTNAPQFQQASREIEPMNTPQPNTTQWLLFAVPKKTIHEPITIVNGNDDLFVADSMFVLPKTRWESLASDMQRTLAEKETRYHYLVRPSNTPTLIRPDAQYVRTYRLKNGDWKTEKTSGTTLPDDPEPWPWVILSEERDILTDLNEALLPSRVVSTALFSPGDQAEQLNLFTREYSPHMLSQPRKFGVTLTFFTVFTIFIAIATLWKPNEE